MQERDRKNNAVSRIISLLLMGVGVISFMIPTSGSGNGVFINVMRVALVAVALIFAIIGFLLVIGIELAGKKKAGKA